MKKTVSILLTLISGLLFPVLSAKSNFLVDNEQIRLLPLSNTGLSGKYVRELATFKVDNPRPAPTANHLCPDSKKAGNLDFVSVPVELLEEAGVARNAAIKFGLPLPQGAVFRNNTVTCINQILSGFALTCIGKDICAAKP